jgi:hypothetical protein
MRAFRKVLRGVIGGRGFRSGNLLAEGEYRIDQLLDECRSSQVVSREGQPRAVVVHEAVEPDAGFAHNQNSLAEGRSH